MSMPCHSEPQRGTRRRLAGGPSPSPRLWMTLLFLFAACASGPPPPTPQFAAVPASVLDVMCARLRDEGIARETTIDVVRTSRPLVTRQSLQALAEAVFYTGRPNQGMVEAAYATNATALPLATNEACSWNLVDAGARRSGDTMTLELSAPFVMPVSKGSVGVLARLALAGESATWYWIPLANKNGTWMAMRSLPLAAHD